MAEKKLEEEKQGVAVLDEVAVITPDDYEQLCECCDPRNPLVMRFDLGTTETGYAQYALCVLHDPPMVYELRMGIYVPMSDAQYNDLGQIEGSDGAILAEEDLSAPSELFNEPDDGGSSGAAADLWTDDEGDSSPQISSHVNLAEDDFYR